MSDKKYIEYLKGKFQAINTDPDTPLYLKAFCKAVIDDIDHFLEA